MKNDINFFKILLFLLLGSSIFFTCNVVGIKKKLKKNSKNIKIESGTIVKFIKAIDGDEIEVIFEKSNFIVRIIGIKAFDPMVKDLLLGSTTKDSFNFLNETLRGKSIKIVFNKFLKDKKNRIIAYIIDNGQDVGLEMIKRGLVFTYTRFKFSKMDEYLKFEKIAMLKKRGLFKNSQIIKRINDIRQKWEVKNK